jgi:hypothetical protein
MPITKFRRHFAARYLLAAQSVMPDKVCLSYPLENVFRSKKKYFRINIELICNSLIKCLTSLQMLNFVAEEEVANRSGIPPVLLVGFYRTTFN